MNARETGSAWVFVYGTLMGGERNHEWLAPYVCRGSPAAVRGRIYILSEGYPMLDPFPAGWVVGELYLVAPAGEALRRLDALEGFEGRGNPDNEYERVRLWTWTGKRGRWEPAVPAWVYIAPRRRRERLAEEARQWPSGVRWAESEGGRGQL
ncbi:MAG: gamma-glutamylcyclotransferase [Alicyclobacillaceae bacterium]|nr:gamma-glutamylcyclotransferase [Alicyclobacillaceae bacterium]